MITIAEFISVTQPKVYGQLVCWKDQKLYVRAKKRILEPITFRALDKLMREVPGFYREKVKL